LILLYGLNRCSGDQYRFRALKASDAAGKITRLAPDIAGAQWLVKKIDSTLRGNIAAETTALQAIAVSDR
jgi:uncharacterized protein YgbK (DUF1537 family)